MFLGACLWNLPLLIWNPVQIHFLQIQYYHPETFQKVQPDNTVIFVFQEMGSFLFSRVQINACVHHHRVECSCTVTQTELFLLQAITAGDVDTAYTSYSRGVRSD